MDGRQVKYPMGQRSKGSEDAMEDERCSRVDMVLPVWW